MHPCVQGANSDDDDDDDRGMYVVVTVFVLLDDLNVPAVPPTSTWSVRHRNHFTAVFLKQAWNHEVWYFRWFCTCAKEELKLY
jgi:hypothetical protein